MAPQLRLLQANINHCARAQDLLLQSMAQWSISIAAVAEPYFVPQRDDWVSDCSGLVTLIVQTATSTQSFENISRGHGFIAAKVGEVVIAGVYSSPNSSLADFESLLSQLGIVCRRSHPLPLLVLGDFNAKSAMWGSRITNARGRVLEEWAVEQNLALLNRGSVLTCVRQRGGSIVDISFASPALARRVREWRVMAEVETLSDHRYIRFDVSPSEENRHGSVTDCGPRWALKRLDKEMLLEAAMIQSWVAPTINIDDAAEWFKRAMSQICDSAMPRVRRIQARRCVYWWSQEIALLRASCTQARRRYARHRRRRRRAHNWADIDTELYDAYKATKRALQSAIRTAKNNAYKELLATIDTDPWGRPYRMVRGKLRPFTPPITRCLRPQLLEDIVSSLFPSREEDNQSSMTPQLTIPDSIEAIPEVTQACLKAAIQRLRAKNSAPGPDGIPGRVIVLTSEILESQLIALFNACLERGHFPPQWKTGKLVLLKKEKRPVDSPSAYRPIVLLDEMGKILERIISTHLTQHLHSVGPDLADNQFGFRSGRSTVDAIMRVRSMSEEAISRGEVVIAVSLDIANAFNTLPWNCIKEALVYHRVPTYLRRIIGAYLTDRAVIYPGRDEWGRRTMSCGVPQGSVLGPLLWNIGYDWVLRGTFPSGVSVICYADDTLVAACGKSHRQATLLATAGAAQVVQRIRHLGLEVALNKSEAICFHGPRRSPPAGAHIIVGGVRINIESTIKYLGLVLDSRWSFKEHFRKLVPKLMGTAGALARLLPNVGGPTASRRKLYVGVVRSMALYGAPVWVDKLTISNVTILRRPQRAMAVRVIRGYRTISFEAASLLAGCLPWDLEAKVLAAMFHWNKDMRAQGERLTPREFERRRSEFQRIQLVEWERRLLAPTAGHATIAAVRPIMTNWLRRQHGTLTFRLTQVLTGHGCFGKYLHRIGREPSPHCHHCEICPEDTAQHTLQECPAWAEQRSALSAVVGDLSLPNVLVSMVRSETAWHSIVSYCEAVMGAKEVAEREREIISLLPSRASRPRRRRRLATDLRPP